MPSLFGPQGLFTTQQAASAGYSPRMIVHLLRARRIVRLPRGIYRLVHYPAGEHEHLVAVWLWSEQLGVFSHITVLALQGLSEALPVRLVLSVPVSWRRRRLCVPPDVELQHAGRGGMPSGAAGAYHLGLRRKREFYSLQHSKGRSNGHLRTLAK
ncbi:MAG: hypothetical protein EOO38_18460 [Cytophagaceae bacterium]|nr:MAG: hypothetical protein EOO38_18460 [Cytophagaceae bacterium]